MSPAARGSPCATRRSGPGRQALATPAAGAARWRGSPSSARTIPDPQQRRTTMNVQPYLSFEGRAQEAIDFYKSALGAKVDMVMHFKDAPPEMQSQMSPGSKDKIMHSAFHLGDT